MRRRRGKKEKQELYELWQQSGLTKTEFCRQNHISTRCMWKWCKEFGKKVITDEANNIKAPTAKDIKFYPIGKVNNNSREDSWLEVSLPNGSSCKAYLSEHSINSFLRELLK